MRKITVDIIVPVHNAAETIEETIQSAMTQCIPPFLLESIAIAREDRISEVGDSYKRHPLANIFIDVAVCCQDDGSSDSSLEILRTLERDYISHSSKVDETSNISTKLLIGTNEGNISLGAGGARNRAAALREKVDNNSDDCKQTTRSQPSTQEDCDYFVCMLDSDDVMHPHRIAHQISVMLALSPLERNTLLLGSTFERMPIDSTWHYTKWANSLTDERLLLERFREVTIIQPTWMMSKSRFVYLLGYIEADERLINTKNSSVYRLTHPNDTTQTLRLAEDIRFFHAHLSESEDIDRKGTLKLIRTKTPLMKYRHRAGQSQSSSTPRKLLLQLRVKAFVDMIIRSNRENGISAHWSRGFVIWGAGRDGKDFFKELPNDIKTLVRSFVDVDEKKISSGYYVAPKNKTETRIANTSTSCEISHKPRRKKPEHWKIPIVHFSLLARDKDKRSKLIDSWVKRENEHNEFLGRITKERPSSNSVKEVNDNKEGVNHGRAAKRQKISARPERAPHSISNKDKQNLIMVESLSCLPVVVCVSLYRTNGVLEANVNSIGAEEGKDLWHFS
jgi:glycosyltransferase involved in cell wall biosynthesis